MVYVYIDVNRHVLKLLHQTSVTDTELVQLFGGYVKVFNVITGSCSKLYLIKETNNVINYNMLNYVE